MRIAIISLLFGILLSTNVLAATITGQTFQGNTLTITYDGIPPFQINIRGDTNIGNPGGFLWANTNEKSYTVNLGFAINPIHEFFFAVKDNTWSETKSTRGENECAPTTCEAQGNDCGETNDGCGGTINCGTCTPPFTVQDIHSVTFYDFGSSMAQRHIHLTETLPAIKAAGFNTVWLVTPWSLMDPQPLSTPTQYNEAEFTQLRQTLQLFKENDMHAIIGLNYLGKGWAPQGINACNWTQDPILYDAFVDYTAHFLGEIQEYNDTVYVLVFTEGTEGCDGWEQTPAEQATTLRLTLGNFPNQLPQNLREKFTIGYHDYTLISRGWSDTSPIAEPISFDFLSMVAYGLDSYDTEEIYNELDVRADRFQSGYPETPLIIGEFGASACSGKDIIQARVDRTIVEYALDNELGFNLWGWKPCPNIECTAPACSGLAIINPDGTPKIAVSEIREAISGLRSEPFDIQRPPLTLTAGGVVTSYTPWAVWASGEGFLSGYANVFDNNAQWGGDLPLTIANDGSFVSFKLPSNAAPSGCNTGKSCTIKIQVTRSTGETSNFINITLPAR